MNKYFNYLLLLILVFLLVLVRAMASKLFYDPYLEYFKNDYLHDALPEIKPIKLYVNLFYRYVINASISLGIIYALFKKEFIKFSFQFYIAAFFILIIALILIIEFQAFSSHLPLFYVRRFLIHPIFVLLLIPAFYYQQKHA